MGHKPGITFFRHVTLEAKGIDRFLGPDWGWAGRVGRTCVCDRLIIVIPQIELDTLLRFYQIIGLINIDMTLHEFPEVNEYFLEQIILGVILWQFRTFDNNNH
jgi:hypothetical protein